MTTPHSGRIDGSFRDPSGFVYRDSTGVLRRQVNRCYAEQFELLMKSRLLDRLADDGLMVRHNVADLAARHSDEAIAVLTPEPIPFFSYPYEWSFSQYRDAALITLDVMDRALEMGMILKDASAFNVTFRGARAVFIDALSFEPYAEGRPWIAYAQFCRHFLAPLALMSCVDPRLGGMLREYLDGIPLDLAARTLPKRSWLSLGLALHVHLHARAESKHAGDAIDGRQAGKVTRSGLRGILSNLRGAIAALRPRPVASRWKKYATEKPYTSEADRDKTEIVGELLRRCSPSLVWDLGANTGQYSGLAAKAGAHVIAFEQDIECVETMYAARRGHDGVTPVWMDLANPSPALGWAHTERDSLVERGPADCVLALALIHHLRIGNNVPFSGIAEFLARIGHDLIVEYVPKDDPMPQSLMRARADIFDDYTRAGFECAFHSLFDIRERRELKGSSRVIYWMRRR